MLRASFHPPVRLTPSCGLISLSSSKFPTHHRVVLIALASEQATASCLFKACQATRVTDKRNEIFFYGSQQFRPKCVCHCRHRPVALINKQPVFPKDDSNSSQGGLARRKVKKEDRNGMTGFIYSTRLRNRQCCTE